MRGYDEWKTAAPEYCDECDGACECEVDGRSYDDYDYDTVRERDVDFEGFED